MSPPGPMAKHPSTRQRRNKASTAREIVLRGAHEALLPVPALPERPEVEGKYGRPAEWHSDTIVAWVEMWQYPLIYTAPSVDRHLMLIYIRLVDAFNYRADKNEPLTELAKEIRPYAEMWGFGEKGRRHLQIDIQQAEEALEKGRRAQVRRVDSSATEFAPIWNEEDEDDGSIMDAEVVS